MSLDQNLFTLQVKPSATDPTIVDLADPTGNVFYRKQRSLGPVYTAHIYDFASQSLLVTTNAPSATSKVKIIELQNPLVPVELKASGTFSVRWAFRWKEHEFEWKREECYIIRKPDPPVLVAITKEIPGRVQFATIQVLDYNLNRFDIEDRKGLELVILSGLLTFLDSADVNQNQNQDSRPRARSSLGSVQPQPSCSNSPSASRHHSTPAAALGSHSISTKSKSSPPTPPPTPPPSGTDFIAQMHALRSVIHEVTVYEEGTIEDYARFCWRLLRDEAMGFITVRSVHSLQVQKVLEVVEATKRLRFQSGMCD
ncbi:hypothetical protein J3R30DRAFT_3305992 [Lentinula aciculospora]|uniref:Uncharacterized protein n=1 Tax=Lentinula aciculospora TaxID=153920 RepID=A0A9W8ZVR6_9AGAR|nr:hypothetical protein J3R30DRAFT_3305992 [Lentinula aciculospora]